MKEHCSVILKAGMWLTSGINTTPLLAVSLLKTQPPILSESKPTEGLIPGPDHHHTTRTVRTATTMNISYPALGVLALAASYASAGPAAYGVCQAGCAAVVMACYSAAGYRIHMGGLARSHGPSDNSRLQQRLWDLSVRLRCRDLGPNPLSV
ncbi:uncharacterized protein BO95DRAFT_430235 [Aspergillus brunneoviolaceus CBS 621.78]|uniref:Uncharacterized protein n=1 Tax=Aspergillus brunneoviolaceus CBS 621.78 TaxID=1450534 RepID=A0ACD1GEF0_9EURO|nr:hypothetical protein BO95DRAFT_430235 [Aspergillus brunneoviolaceus CBS 621.78]RAH47582.1 hypothetical protein BO95DRAFT_430235 [Aspergillus brunneoviolaceus CBS 621.78]